MAKCAGTDKFLANSAVSNRNTSAAEDEVQSEIVTKMGEFFGALAMAAKASKAMYDDQSRTISTLMATNAELSAAIKAHR